MNGVASAGHPATARAAADILGAGGNAADAAIAGAVAAFVCEPMLSSAGGGGMMIVATEAACEVIDFFSDAPGLGGAAGDLDFAGVDIDFGATRQEFHVGRGAASVPGALPGLAEVHRRHGSMPLAELVAPACELAVSGAPATAETVLTFELLWPILTREPATAAVLAPSGRPPRAGEAVGNPALGDTLRAWSRDGAVPAHLAAALESELGPAAGGLITRADIDHYRPRILASTEIAVGDATVDAPPSVGGRLVAVILEHLCAGPVAADESGEVVRHAAASAAGSRARQVLIAPPHLPGSTTHVSAMDASGGVAAVTLSNGEGCGHVLADTGVHVNNFLGEEDLSPHGFHRHTPGVRLPTMMSPMVVRRGGRPIFALGSGGANRIRTALGQTLYRALARGSSIIDAVYAPRVHAEGGEVWFETQGLADADAVAAALGARYPEVHAFAGRSFVFGGVHAVGVDGAGRQRGVGDPRRGGVAIVV